ncbi:glycine zipper 2TM domain-containing protein [Rhodoferax sp.]|uniref:glycine zipper 2TM domain-containing protein n=1 Tax=Rhodoferax sp. TaxID=50421 RepID=UPI0025F6D4B3|nr:glycine zipper 2TM domain-containing protein [Rhodoferax sp.]
MSTVVSTPGAVAATGNKWMWAAMGALGASTLALGAVVLHQQSAATPAEVPLEVLAISTPAPAPAAPLPAPELEKNMPKQAVAPVKNAPVAPKKVATNLPAKTPAPVAEVAVAQAAVSPVATPSTQPAPVRLPAKVVCAQCGTVEAVTPVQRESANPSGAGAVAGAVLGGLVGNQFGGGDGKALATIAGVLGGGWAGNTVEKRLKKETVYLVDVRMEDGSLRSIEQSAPASVGQAVRVEGGRISPDPAVNERNPASFSSAT